MTRLILLAIALVAGCMSDGVAAVRSDEPGTILGRWLTPHRDGVFQIDRCGNTVCGRLVGMRYTGSMPLDVHRQPQCGLLLLTGFRPGEDPGRWTGTIMDPDSGHRYQATIWSPDADTLKLRGYVLVPFLGETQTWIRYSGPIGSACQLPPWALLRFDPGRLHQRTTGRPDQRGRIEARPISSRAFGL